MNRSRDAKGGLLPEASAPQHERAVQSAAAHAPRPLPLFLELLRELSERDPATARDALAGLRAYEHAPRLQQTPLRPVLARIGGATVHDYGGEGPPALLIPSLINPPRILDLDADVSLAGAVAKMGRKSLLLDWGPAASRAHLSIGGHIEAMLAPLSRELGEPAALIGYCLGGTMAIAAANLVACERVVTLAAPWHFGHYPAASRSALRDMWMQSKAAATRLGALPMEVLQAAFWSLDPARTVKKFAQLGRLDPGSPQFRRFVELEDWANEGEALPNPAAKELIEDLFGKDLPGRGRWSVGGKIVSTSIDAALLNILAGHDRIAPADTAPPGPSIEIASGHVGMVVGSAHAELHTRLKDFLAPCR